VGDGAVAERLMAHKSSKVSSIYIYYVKLAVAERLTAHKFSKVPSIYIYYVNLTASIFFGGWRGG
jgi:hypothetical protein